MVNSLSQAFGAVVRERRLAAGISQEGLAQAADLHPTYVSMVERGIRNPTLDVAQRLANALNIGLPDLVKRAEKHRDNQGRKRR